MYGHPTVAVLPACLAVGEFLGVNGLAILESYIIGLEVAVKLAYGMNPAITRKAGIPPAHWGPWDRRQQLPSFLDSKASGCGVPLPWVHLRPVGFNGTLEQ